MSHVVQKVLMQAHRPRMQRYSSRRPRDKVRRQRPPRRVKHDALIWPTIINRRHCLLFISGHGKIKRPSSRLFQYRIQKVKRKVWIYFTICPLWNQVVVRINENEEQWRPRVVYKQSGETFQKNEWGLQHEDTQWRHNFQGPQYITKILWITSRLNSSSYGLRKRSNIG